MYQIELAILFSVMPSLKKTSENSLQGSFRRVQSRFCPLSFDGTLTYPSRMNFSIIIIIVMGPYCKGTLNFD
jgi:hypothetical protein